MPEASPYTRGFRAAVDGMKLAFRNKEVGRAYLKISALIFVLAIALTSGSMWALWANTSPEAYADAASWVTVALWAARVVGSLLSLILGPLMAIFIANIAFPLLNVGVFLAGLRAVDPERAEALAAKEGMSVARSIAIPTWRLIKFLLLTLCLMIVGLIPVIGTIIATATQAWLTARAVAWELVDPYFECLDIRHAEQREFINKHQKLLIGFGLPISLMLAIPIVGPLLFGLAQAAGAVLVAREIPIDPREG